MEASQRQRIYTTILVGMLALLIGEAVYLTATEQVLRAWMIPFYLGVGALPALVISWLGTRCWWTWRDIVGGGRSLPVTSSWLVTAGLLLPLWVAATARAIFLTMGTVATPWMAAAQGAVFSVVLLLLSLALAGLIQPHIKRLLTLLGRRRWSRWLTHPASWLVLGTIAAISAISLAFYLAPEILRVLPWAYVIGPAAAIFAGLLAHYILRARPHRAQATSRILTALLALLTAASFALPMSLREARQIFVDRSTLASHFYHLIEPHLDFDGDGSLSFFAGGDCAPFDPHRGPNQREIPNDGIDQNCSGFDLVVDVDDFHGGPKRVDLPEGIAKRPHVILITTDALSFPNTTPGGYERDVTPNLARWAEGATVFETAFSNSTSTRLAMPGLIASKMNSQIHLMDGRVNPYDYHPDEETLATILNDAGYRTVHIPGTRYFAERWAGYWNGFDEVDIEAYRRAADKEHTSPALTDAAIELIENHDDDQPLHLWIHYYDHHSPYIIPEGGQVFGEGRTNQDKFDSELHFADRNWGRLLDIIEARWEPQEYILVFTSDHGEAFDENHPREHHDFSVYTRPTHVPLIIQAPWPKGRGARIEGLTGHIDIVPTIANLIGAAPRKDWLGESLIPSLAEGISPQKSVIYSLFYIPEAAKRGEFRFQMIGARTEEWYYFENRRRGERRLVRWREDPLDRDNFERREPELFETYRFLVQNKQRWLLDREIGLTHSVDSLGSDY